ncbi:MULTISPECIES: polysaccharide deacetylase family protein [Rhodopseudomonas]|uniref:Chitooligosaccharide deacetylase n=1 Tax=Rhodopseudomonas palustris TaxID=1076 RepID=A0A0D7EM74_RHOPL|nr:MULTISPECIES: polysaccharide deacetylase family protein [Rhodopseudomonas]KIZ40557.1 polysaccharide deacetylase [Rhodopseudomonas palustris]MDF3808808.1 polysaccharide deacetylase family protein [Rhodopseudomonas sp. BAL398]WOK19158.1 polysaccharide deacetylase family protein [Rhodopseudomonas sp. BAL398]
MRNRIWAAARQLAYFSGVSRLVELAGGGAGAILRIRRVRPARKERFQPLKSSEITPQALDRLIRAIRRWHCEVIPLEEVCARIAHPGPAGRFVCLTFDGADRDLMAFAYPVLSRHRVPFTVYLPTAFVDGVGEAWWLALEQVIAATDRVALLIDDVERRFDTTSVADKVQAYHYLDGWLRSLPPAELSAAINDLCKRYAVDLAQVSREAALNWDHIATLAADPNVSFGSATVNYPILANLDDSAAQKEIIMGRAVARAALGREVAHFGYPFGDRGSFNARHVGIVAQAGFASAVTALPGTIGRKPVELHALPRVTWDGRGRSLRALRVMLSGL